jgi:hypothetical protein
MNGDGIWRSPKARGVGANPYAALFNASNEPLRRWKRQTLEVLRRHVSPDASSRATREESRDYRVPVLSPGDRRAFLQALWAPYLPEATWQGVVTRPEGSAQVYLDVSGSMNAEMPLIVGLLGQLSRHIRRPFWAFSDEVAPARIVNGQLQAATSGGTRMTCVIEHLQRTRPAAAVVVTDGYIEPLSAEVRARAANTRLHAIVTRDGNPARSPAPAFPTPSSGGCRHDPHFRNGPARAPGQVLRPGRRRGDRRLRGGGRGRLRPGRGVHLVGPRLALGGICTRRPLPQTLESLVSRPASPPATAPTTGSTRAATGSPAPSASRWATRPAGPRG